MHLAQGDVREGKWVALTSKQYSRMSCSEGYGYLKIGNHCLMTAGGWEHRGPKVHGRKYKEVEESNGEWVALVSDQKLDTLNAELLLLRNDTEPMRPGAGGTSHNGSATVRLSAALKIAVHKHALMASIRKAVC